MNDTVLMILSVRNIQSVKDCIDKLNCEKIWFKGYKEFELTPILNKFIENSNFTNYFIAPDDLIIKPENFDLLKKYLNFYDIVSGWGMYRQNSDHTTVIKPNNFKNFIAKYAYCNPKIFNNILNHTYKPHEIHDLPDVIETAFTGWFFTGMNKKIWMEYPYQTLNWPWSSSDLMFSKRVFDEGKYKQHIIKKAHVVHLSNLNHKSFHDMNDSFINKSIIKTF